MPTSRASSTASDDGADTAASTGMPAIAAFWVSSKLARPLTISTCPASGSRPARTPSPMTLSTALCRPTSSRSATSSPVGGEQAGRVQAAGLVEHLLRRAQPVGQREQHLQRQPRARRRPRRTRVFVRIASMLALPQTPHELEV